MNSKTEFQPLAVSTAEAAELLGVSERHLANLNADGRLGPKPVRLGHSVRWPVDELRAWLAAGCPHREQWQAMKADRLAALRGMTNGVLPAELPT